ncbi:MAG: transposase [Pseudomonadota bacterium]
MTTLTQSTKRKLSLLQLAEELGNVSKACKIMGYHRDTFYEVRRAFQMGGVAGLVESRRGPRHPHPNRVAPEVEEKILAMALERPTIGAQRVANELRLQGVNVSPSGVRGVWQRHDLLTRHKRLMRLEQQAQDTTFVLNDQQIRLLERHSCDFRMRREEKRQWEGRPERFTNKDFRFDPDKHTCICPAGKALYSNGRNITVNGYAAVKFTAPKSACRPCHPRSRCLKFPDRTVVRQVAFFTGEYRKPETFTQMMKRKIDSLAGKAVYNRRIATVEPVFGHLRNLGLERFTLRGRKKVDAQWKLYCMVHNLLKIHRYGVGFG